MTVTPFVRSYNDQSTDNGFQFEFYCDRCDSGYQTDFVPAGFNTVVDVLDAAGNIFGGILGSVADIGERARSATWEKEHNAAFKNAVNAMKPYFTQCPDCGQWVDKVCWSEKARRCKECLPEAEEEAEASPATCPCPLCEAEAPTNAKFCPECGDPLQKARACKSCGEEGSGKFCASCGEKL
jgi:hypothetical protein